MLSRLWVVVCIPLALALCLGARTLWAQVSVSPGPGPVLGNPVPPEATATAVPSSPGWQEGAPIGSGRTYYRVEADGEVVWKFDENNDGQIEKEEHVYSAPGRPDLAVVSYFQGPGIVSGLTYGEGGVWQVLIQYIPQGALLSNYDASTQSWRPVSQCTLPTTQAFRDQKYREFLTANNAPGASSLDKKRAYAYYQVADSVLNACKQLALRQSQ